MRSKGTHHHQIFYLPLSASLSCMPFLLPEQSKKEHNRKQSLPEFSGEFLSHQSRFFFHKLYFNASDAPWASVYGHCAHHSSLKHSIFQRSGFFACLLFVFPRCTSYYKTPPGTTRGMDYTCTHQNAKSVPFSLCPPFSILSGNSYFPSLTPFHHFFGINTFYIQCLKGYG